MTFRIHDNADLLTLVRRLRSQGDGLAACVNPCTDRRTASWCRVEGGGDACRATRSCVRHRNPCTPIRRSLFRIVHAWGRDSSRGGTSTLSGKAGLQPRRRSRRRRGLFGMTELRMRWDRLISQEKSTARGQCQPVGAKRRPLMGFLQDSSRDSYEIPCEGFLRDSL